MPAPKGNLNAAKNGKHLRTAIRYGLTIGELPSSMVRIKQRTRKYRQFLEDAVAAAHGGVSVTQAHVIDEVAGYEMHALVCRWLLRHKFEGMTAGDIAACSKAIATAKTARNKALAELDIDAASADPWNGILNAEATLIAPQIAPPEPQTPENNGKSGQCSSPASTPEGETSASPSAELAFPNAPESTLASAGPNVTDDTRNTQNASEAKPGEATQGNPSNGDQRDD